MSEDRIPPHHLQAEEHLLGALLLSQDAVKKSIDIISQNDFYVPSHRVVFDVITKLHSGGQPIDPVTVADGLRREGTDVLEWVGGQRQLVAFQAGCPSTAAAERYARIIVDHALLRQLIRLGERIIENAYEFMDAAEILDIVKADIASIDLPSVGLPEGLICVDDFMKKDMEVSAPWIIPGLFRGGWRMMIVAEEGAGKTLLSQQLALAAARGVHPFTTDAMEPISTLVVDAENPEERIYEGFQMVEQGMVTKDFPPGLPWLWHRPGGINLRTRTDRASFEEAISHIRPKLVCICPLYKVYSNNARESDEVAARELMTVFDDLRTRYNFALLIEHHAPKEQNGVRRLNPYGTVLWQRWCEMGRSLVRSNHLEDLAVAADFDLSVGFRGDRVKNEWPRHLRKSPSGLPWEARWDARILPPAWRHIDNEDDPF